MRRIETPAEATLDRWGGHKLWNQTMKRSVSHSKTPASENKPGGLCTVMTGTSWRDASSQSEKSKRSTDTFWDQQQFAAHRPRFRDIGWPV